MPNRRAPYTQADVTRATRGVVAAGLKVREVISSSQGVRVIVEDENAPEETAKRSWDDLIDDAP